MTLTQAPPARRLRPLLRWTVSFAGFPLGGLAAMLLVGPVDSPAAAVLGGLLTGVVIGVVQAWALRLGRVDAVAWVAGTGAGLALGLMAGALLVGFGTTLPQLALQGAVSGAVVGVGQAVVLARRVGPLAAAWPLYLASVWALGWAVTTAIGVQVGDRFTVFGSTGRASDYFGPGVTQSALGDAVFGAAVQGKTAQLMGDPRQPHSYSYAPDVAAGLVRLGTADGATGQIWHLPVTETRTIRATVEAVYAAAGTPPRLLAAGGWLLRAMALFQPAMREYLHTLYQFTEPWVVDDSKFWTAFGDHSTPLDQAIRSTVAWYRERLHQPVQARLKEHTP